MKQTIEQHHNVDDIGNAAGGRSKGIGFDIEWQHGREWQDGPLGRSAERKPPNGANVEGVLEAVIGRLHFLQGHERVGRGTGCREYAIAIPHLETALLWLNKRAADREEREAEGKHAP